MSDSALSLTVDFVLVLFLLAKVWRIQSHTDIQLEKEDYFNGFSNMVFTFKSRLKFEN
jgi:hypothetical protein